MPRNGSMPLTAIAPDAPRVRRRYVDGRWGQTHVYLAEPAVPLARPVVCYHLSLASGQLFRPFLAEIGRDRQAIAPDTPGYGNSDSPLRPEMIPTYAAVHGELLDALGVAECDLVGTHTGARIAVELAHQRPQQIRHLFLVGVGVHTEEERRNITPASGFVEASDDASHIAEIARGWARWRWDGVTTDMVERYVADNIRDFARANWGLAGIAHHDLAGRLSTLEQPVFVLNTKDDSFESTRRAKDLIRRGRYIERTDWGHWALEVKPSEIAALAPEFFAADRAQALNHVAELRVGDGS